MPLGLNIGGFAMEQVSYDMTEASDATGDDAIRLFGPPRWRVNLSSPPAMALGPASDWEAMALALRRGVNCLAVWDPIRIAPRGTLRGAITLNAAAAAGASALQLAGAAGTLLHGDWLQVSTGVGTSQLIKVMVDTTAAAGVASVTFEPGLRIAFAAGTVVTWDRPVFYARSVGKSTRWDYPTGGPRQGAFTLDLLETFA